MKMLAISKCEHFGSTTVLKQSVSSQTFMVLVNQMQSHCDYNPYCEKGQKA